MKYNDLVSIIIPCYNQAQYLEEAVQSALDQTYPNIEIIIVNDDSPDNTQVISEKLQKQYPEKIQVIFQKNSGVSEARNNGIRQSRGQYILPLDADDILDVKMISQCMDAIIQTNADIVHGGLQCFGERDDVWMSKPFSENNILYENLPHGSSLYRKKVWEKIKGYKNNMMEGYEDWEFWINAYKHNFTFQYLSEILFYYRIKKLSRDTLAMKKDIYLKAKIMLNHPDLYTVNQVKESINTLKETEKLADLYFYHDKNIIVDEKKLILEVGLYLKDKHLEEKHILKIFDKNIGLYALDTLKDTISLQELYQEMNVDFILYYAPLRYKVPSLQHSRFAWEIDQGVILAQGTLFQYVFKDIREDDKQQLKAYQKFENHMQNFLLRDKKQKTMIQNRDNGIIMLKEQIEKQKIMIENRDKGIKMLKEVVDKQKIMIENRDNGIKKLKEQVDKQKTMIENRDNSIRILKEKVKET